MNTVELDGEHLTIEQVIAVAYGEPNAPRVVLAEHAKAKIERSAHAVQRLLADGTIAYGITTGFGAFKDKVIAPEQVEKLQYNILVSHAVGVGDPFDKATTRAWAFRHSPQYPANADRFIERRRPSDNSRKGFTRRKRRFSAIGTHEPATDWRRRGRVSGYNSLRRRSASTGRFAVYQIGGERRISADERHKRDVCHRCIRNSARRAYQPHG
jgi:hypothetical protein